MTGRPWPRWWSGSATAGAPPPSTRPAAAATHARAALGQGAYERAYGRGGAFGLADLVAYALDEQAQPPSGQAESRTAPVRLTRRETEVAELVAEGLGNQQIADRLVIARRTAEGHLERVLGKLGFSNRSQIAAWVTARR
ncbi:helix-turn-helix transcriptional regulator [Streptomyces sp. NBC_00631]|uniref:helix-turn-helix domain-containing protein n=1 Tax=Streptomyces sp. NBC_00631 TaxID=2975793 RepID=UPI0030E26BAC